MRLNDVLVTCASAVALSEEALMAVEYTGYYDNFCIYCHGGGVVEDFDGEIPCSACDGKGQWDDDPWGFIYSNSKNQTVECVLCGAHGWGIATHNRDGERLTPIVPRLILSSPWQRKHYGPHTHFCACGRVFPDTHGLGTHVSAHRRHHNPGHGSMERVGY